MRILHVVDSLDPRMGGTARASVDICAGLTQRGQDVLLVATADPEEASDDLMEDGQRAPHQLFSRCFPQHNFRSPALRRWLTASVADYDLVDIHGIFSFVPLYAAKACQRSGVPYTVRPHGSLDPFDMRKHNAAKRALGPLLFRPLLHRAKAVILTSQTEADRLITFGANPTKVVLPLPVIPPALAGDGGAFRMSYGIPEEALVVLLLGRIHPKKGLQLLIPSLAGLKCHFPNLWFLAVGTGEAAHLAELDDLLRRHDMTSWSTRCQFLTGAPKQSAFAASDVFALPSFNENFGIAVVEAMYARLPVLLSNEVYIHEVIASGGAGLVCEPTVTSCSSGLRNMLSNEPARREMARRGPDLARHHFGLETALGSLESVYRQLLDGHP